MDFMAIQVPAVPVGLSRPQPARLFHWSWLRQASSAIARLKREIPIEPRSSRTVLTSLHSRASLMPSRSRTGGDLLQREAVQGAGLAHAVQLIGAF